ncbi:MAG: hypothetical protein ACFFG0_49715 [Candidatus Thorarchaeota archaeon]
MTNYEHKRKYDNVIVMIEESKISKKIIKLIGTMLDIAFETIKKEYLIKEGNIEILSIGMINELKWIVNWKK